MNTIYEMSQNVGIKSKVFLKYCFLTVLWILIGAFIFLFMESCTDQANDIFHTKKKKLLDKYKFICEEILRTQNNSDAENCSRLLYDKVDETTPNKPICEVTWSKLSEWIQFCGVTLTTIGYGMLTPKTDSAKLFLTFFASIGIPITLQTYTLAGRMLHNKICKLLTLFEKRFLKHDEIKYKQFKVFLLSATMFTIVLNIAAFYATLDYFHGLTYVDGVYFWYVSLTTIGFGDITTPPERYVKQPFMIIFDDIFTVFGLGMMAATVDSFIEFFATLPENSWRRPCIVFRRRIEKPKNIRKISCKTQPVMVEESPATTITKIYSRMSPNNENGAADLRNMVV